MPECHLTFQECLEVAGKALGDWMVRPYGDPEKAEEFVSGNNRWTLYENCIYYATERLEPKILCPDFEMENRELCRRVHEIACALLRAKERQ